MSDHDRDDDGGALVVDRPPTEDRERLEPPMDYAVILLNDDFTPMDFVMAVLTKLFGKSVEEAEKITMQIHEQGSAMAMRASREICETRAAQVNQSSQAAGHPFKADIAPIQ